MIKGQAKALRINVFGTKDSYLDSNRLSCEKNWNSTPSASGSYGRQADRLAGTQKTAGFQNLGNPLQVKLFRFYFVYSCAMLLIV